MRYIVSALSLAMLCAAAGSAQNLVPLNSFPSRIVGHPATEQFTINSSNPNLVEGREFYSPQGIALDTSLNPPALYVSDTGNSRILAWRNSTAFTNGQAADLVIGQSSLQRTNAGGPSVSGSAFSTGLNNPSGILVHQGDVYVVDSGNNRILRFRKPFDHIGDQFPDLHIGQPNFSSGRANYTGQVDRQGLSFSNGSTVLRGNIAFDTAGNLWVVDSGNRRVLRFAASDVSVGGGPLTANLVIGQLDFNSVQAAVTVATRTKADAFALPSSIVFDPAGRLYITDNVIASGNTVTQGRVLVFSPPYASGMAASRMMGVIPGTSATQDTQDRTLMYGTEGLFFMPEISKMGVADSASNRILVFDSYEAWPDQATQFSPVATAVIGQPDFHNRGRNGGLSTYNVAGKANSFSSPTAVAFSGAELFVADSNNNRVLALPFADGSFGAASRVLGQDVFHGQSINLIEGREFFFAAEAGIAIDNYSETPHLYVADYGNNRILGFNDVRKVQPGTKADLVIGQADFTTALCNFQGLDNPDSGNPDRPTASSICLPTGLLVDTAGNLYVADSGNSRVLRFPAPFSNPGTLPQADLVLGQRNFTTTITDPTPSTMSAPYGLSFATDNGLLVSDLNHNRVLYFRFTANGTFTAGADNGRAADKVFGQDTFFANVRSNAVNGMANPRHISADNEARLYVADSGNNRVLIFDQINTVAAAGAPAAKILTGFTTPRSIVVNPITSDSWVGDDTTTVDKYPRFAGLLVNAAATGGVNSFAGLALAQDNYGNLAIADASHRIAFYFPGLQAVNGANFMQNRQLAPGVFASICSPGSACDPSKAVSEFGSSTADFRSVTNGLPFPKSIADVEVRFSGEPAPLTYVSPTQINFVVPMSAPTSGTAELQVVQTSTGRIYAAGTVAMDTYSPGIFMTTYSGPLRQAAVINQDGTINSPTNPAPRGTYVQIFATGQGFIPDAPPDGDAPQVLTRTLFTPRAFIGTCYVDECPRDSGEQAPSQGYIGFSGLSPQFPGVWQINVYIPKLTAPGAQIPLAIIAGAKANIDPTAGFNVAIAVR